MIGVHWVRIVPELSDTNGRYGAQEADGQAGYHGARRPTVGGGYFHDPDDNLVEFTVDGRRA